MTGPYSGTVKRILIAVLVVTALAACSEATNPEPPASSAASDGPNASPPAPTEPTVTGEIARNLEAPWSVVPLSGGRALISERDTAKILLLDNGQTSEIGNPPEVLPGGEGGLLGLAVQSPDPDTVYAYYTAATDNRVVAFDFDGERLSNERTILGGIPKGFIHNGGRIAFGPDGFLYVATGETGEPDLAQDRSSLAGKILRITPICSVR